MIFMKKKQWYLGKTFNDGELVYLEDFKWECDWYWAGGHIISSQFFCHFDGCFLDVPDSRGHPLGNFLTPWSTVPGYLKENQIKIIRNGAAVWEPLSFFLDDAQYDEEEWWRIKDLFKQFYALKKAAETFLYGGYCTDMRRTPQEINPDMARQINAHIETVVILEIRRALDK